MMCQYKFVFGNKCTTLVVDVDKEEATHVWKQYKSLYLSFDFIVNLKFLLINSFF